MIEVFFRDRIVSHQKTPPTNANKNVSDHHFIGIKNFIPSHRTTLFLQEKLPQPENQTFPLVKTPSTPHQHALCTRSSSLAICCRVQASIAALRGIFSAGDIAFQR
jgi:hypothetical protein